MAEAAASGFNVPSLTSVFGPAGMPNAHEPPPSKPSELPVQVMTDAVVTQSANADEFIESIVEQRSSDESQDWDFDNLGKN